MPPVPIGLVNQEKEIWITKLRPLLMTGMSQGSAGNVIAALASIFVPGLGQLVQGRFLAAFVQFVLAGILWAISLGTLGWIMHIISCIEAARWKGRTS